MKRVLLCLMVMICGIGLLGGCSGYNSTELVNTSEFDASSIKNIKMDLDADNITVLQSDNSKVVLKEYMNKDKEKYYAECDQNGTELQITEGDRPLSSKFESYAEICIPTEYNGNINLHSTSGEIKSVSNFEGISAFGFDTTSGIINVENLDIDNVNVSSTNGNALLKNVSGKIKYVGKGGNFTGNRLSGSGSFEMTGDGALKIDFIEVSGDISAYSKNETLSINLPSSLTFDFEAKTKNGSVKTSFDNLLKTNDDTTTGTVGQMPNIKIKLESRNGDVVVNY